MIRLFNYKNNFGDELSPYIISKLSGKKVVYRKPFSFKRFFLDCLRFLKKLLLKGELDKSLIMFSPFHKVLICIGSILEESTNNTIVWGAGLGTRNINISGGKFLAVRGPLSQMRLLELGYPCPNTIGDPAILTPLIYPISNLNDKRFKIGIIPHNIDFEDTNNAVSKSISPNILVLNLNTADVEKVISDIISCNYILSSSLHGLIVAHAYNIPAIRFQKNTLFGDGSKFEDYFLSVHIPIYNPLNFSEIDFTNPNKLEELFQNAEAHSLPKIHLSELQKSLLNSAPFIVDKSFKF